MAARMATDRPTPPLYKRLTVFGQVSMVLGGLVLAVGAPFAARLGSPGGWAVGTGVLALGGGVYLLGRRMRRSARRRAGGRPE